MTAILYVAAPTRRPGETGRDFVARMLAELDRKGAATAAPPRVEITAKVARIAKALLVEVKPALEVEPLPPCKSPHAYAPTATWYEIWLEQRHKWRGPPSEPFGPTYPALPGANKWRKLANGRELSADEKREYGQTVLDGINALNAKLLERVVTPPRSNSASGTFHNNGEDILKAIRAQNRARL